MKQVTYYKREGGKTFKDSSRPAQAKHKDGAPPAEGQPPSKPSDSENRNKGDKTV